VNNNFIWRINRLRAYLYQSVGVLKSRFARGEKINAYWYDRIVNFGDLLTPSILIQLGLIPINSNKNDSDIISTGSILDNLSEDYNGYIIGSGLMYDVKRKFPNAKIRAVRGELTRSRIGAPMNIVLADPGIIADDLIKERLEKKYELGIVPHYMDKNNENIKHIFNRYYKEILIIDVQRNPKQVISDIDKCCFILSSSLHGLVVADSLDIPNAWVVLSDKVLGNGFKFYDYQSAFYRETGPYKISGYEKLNELRSITKKPHPIITDIKYNLHQVFNVFRDEYLTK